MRLSVHLSSPIPWKIKEKHHCHRYIIDIVIHVIVNWQLSKQGIHWPVSHDDIVVSLRVTCFFFQVDSCPGTGLRLDHRLKQGYYSEGRKEHVQRLHFRIGFGAVVRFESSVALIFKHMTNWLLCGWIVSTTHNQSFNINSFIS